jgi:hypothetical protein
VPRFSDRRRHVVSMTVPYGRILGFLDRSRYFLFQVNSSTVLTRLSGSVPDPLLLRISGSEGNRNLTSGSAARNYDH